jgi:hypothetical protein
VKADVEALVTSMLTTGGRQGHEPGRTVTMMLVAAAGDGDAVRQGLLVRNVVACTETPAGAPRDERLTLGQTSHLPRLRR